MLFAWGNPADLLGPAWTLMNATRFAGSAIRNPFGELGVGVTGVANTAGNMGYIQHTVTITDAATVVPVWVSPNESGSLAIQLLNGAGTISARLVVTLSVATGAVSSVAPEAPGVTVDVRGAAVATGAAGNAATWNLVLACFTGFAPGSYTLRFFPNFNAPSVAASTYFYLRPTWTHGFTLDSALAYPVARPGSATLRSAAGVEDAWDAGTDEELTGVLRWIPREFSANPACSGYDGAGTDLVGLGLRSLLRQGRLRNVIRYVRDRADCSQFTDGYLVEPYTEFGGSVETDGTVSLPIRLRSTTPYRGAL